MTDKSVRSEADIEIRPLGDSAVIVQLRETGRPPEGSSDEVRCAARLLEQADIPGVTEITTAFTTVAVFYEPARISRGNQAIFDSMESLIRSVLTSGIGDEQAGRAEQPLVEIPVCYDAEFGFDIADVASHCRLPVEEVTRRHSSAEYAVATIGFTPGFPYLAGLPAELETPRRAAPRPSVPAGSVGIAGIQTGVYPMNSPGGWQIIGRTPLRLFDPTKPSPALLTAGDRVRFRPITREEFYASAADAEHAEVQVPANK